MGEYSTEPRGRNTQQWLPFERSTVARSRPEYCAKRFQRRRMVYRRMPLLLHGLVMPLQSGRRVGLNSRGKAVDPIAALLEAAGEPQSFVRLGLRAQALGSGFHQGATVPPQARVDGDVAVEQVRLQQKGFDHEEAGEGFADDRRLIRGAIARSDIGHQLVAQEFAERRRAAD